MSSNIERILKAIFKGKDIQIPEYEHPLSLSPRGWIGWKLGKDRYLFCDITINQFLEDVKDLSEDQMKQILSTRKRTNK